MKTVFKHALSMGIQLLLLPMLACGTPGQSGTQSNLVLDSIHLEREYRAAEEAEAPSMHIAVSLLYPTAHPDSNVLRKIRQVITRDFYVLADGLYEDAYALAEAYMDYHGRDYIKTMHTLWTEFPSATNHWQDERHMNLDWNDGQILSYTTKTERYTGGAHGYGATTHTVIDLQTGNRLHESDVFRPDAMAFVKRLLLNAIMEQEGVDNATDLNEKGYFDPDRIKPNDNFLINDQGIVYSFSEYEIASYANGRTRVLLPFDSIRPLLRSDAPLSHLFSK